MWSTVSAGGGSVQHHCYIRVTILVHDVKCLSTVSSSFPDTDHQSQALPQLRHIGRPVWLEFL